MTRVVLGLLLLLGGLAEAARLRRGVPTAHGLANVTEDTPLRKEDQEKMQDLESAIGDMQHEATKREVREAQEKVVAWTAASSAPSHPDPKPAAPEPSTMEKLANHVAQASEGSATERLGSLDEEFNRRLAKSPTREAVKSAAPAVQDEEQSIPALAARLGKSNKLQEEASDMEAFYSHTPSPDTVMPRGKDAIESTEDLRESMHRFVSVDSPKPKPAPHAYESWRDMADRLSIPSLD